MRPLSLISHEKQPGVFLWALRVKPALALGVDEVLRGLRYCKPERSGGARGGAAHQVGDPVFDANHRPKPVACARHVRHVSADEEAGSAADGGG